MGVQYASIQVRAELHSDDQHDAAGTVYVRHTVLSSSARPGVRSRRHGLQHGISRHARQLTNDLCLWRRGVSFPSGLQLCLCLCIIEILV